MSTFLPKVLRWKEIRRAAEYVMAVASADKRLKGKGLSPFTTEKERIEKVVAALQEDAKASKFADFESKTQDLEILATICYGSVPLYTTMGLRWIRGPAMDNMTMTDDNVEELRLRVLGVLARDNATNTYYIVCRGTDIDPRTSELLICTGPASNGDVWNLNNMDQMSLDKMFNLSDLIDGDSGDGRASLGNFMNAQIYYKDANGKTELLLDSLNNQFKRLVGLIPEKSNVKVYAHSMGTCVSGSVLLTLGTCGKNFKSKEALFLGPYGTYNRKGGQTITKKFGGSINNVMNEHDFISRMNTLGGALYPMLFSDGALDKYDRPALIKDHMTHGAANYPYELYGDVHAFHAPNWFTWPWFNHLASTYRLVACKAPSEKSLAKVDTTSTHVITYVDGRGDAVDIEDEELRAIVRDEDERSWLY